MKGSVGAIAITMFAALSACGEGEDQRKNSADANGKFVEERETPSGREYIETPDWVPSDYRRLSSVEIVDLLNKSKLLSNADERTKIIFKAGHSYEMKSFGNRTNGGIASHGNWMIEGDALVPANELDGTLILFVQLEDESETPSDKIFGFVDKSGARELTAYSIESSP